MGQADYQYEPSGAGLDDRIEAVWHLRHGGDDAPQFIAPDGSCEIILHRATPPLELREGNWIRQDEAFLYGPLDRVLKLQQTGPMDVMGIRLRPWALGALGARPTHWRNRPVPLAGIVGSGPAGELLAHARKAGDPRAFRASADALLDRLLPRNDTLAAGRALVESLESGAEITTAGLARRFAVTERTISRRFERACGLTARDMVRIVRFHHARDAIKRGVDLVEVADMAGYADQAHMTREFRHFAGITPVPARHPAAYDALYTQRSTDEM